MSYFIIKNLNALQIFLYISLKLCSNEEIITISVHSVTENKAVDTR